MTYLQRAINYLAKQTVTPTETPQADIIRIYELTYKLQMLKQEEKLGDYGTGKTLNDQAYMELSKIKGDLERSLNAMFDSIQQTYKRYTNGNPPYMESKKELLYRFEEVIVDKLYWQIKDMTIKELFNKFGERKIERALRDTDYIWQTKKLQSVQDIINNFDTLSVKKRSTIIAGLCENYILLSDVLKQVPLSEFQEMYKKEDSAWRVYTMSKKLNIEWPGSNLSKKIILFQEALTTAHETGKMADYLIQGRNPEALLRALSSESNPYVPKWDQDLTKLLGHPPGSTIAPPKDVWIQPASKRLARVVNMLLKHSEVLLRKAYLIQGNDLIKKVLDIEEHSGYELRTELWDGSDYGGPDIEMVSAYNLNGDYIGDLDSAKFIVDKKGIAPEISQPDHTVCSIGFCEKDQKWYGWSHRALVGFGIGDMLFEEDFGDDNTPYVEHGTVEIETLDQAEEAAKNFAQYVS